MLVLHSRLTQGGQGSNRVSLYPESASGPKRRQIEAYGAELIPVAGSRSEVAAVVRKVADGGTPYASHAYIPFNLPGYATVAYEIFEQLGQMPGAVIVPAGQGGLLLGLACGFDALCMVKKTERIPKVIGVQAHACAPLWATFTLGDVGLGLVTEGHTLAEGVRVLYPLRGDVVVAAIKASRGTICIVDEEEIIPAHDKLAQLGFYVEPTSAIVLPALSQMLGELPDPVVAILTGSGLKYE